MRLFILICFPFAVLSDCCQLGEVYLLTRVCVFLTDFCPTERKKKSSPQVQVL